MIGCVVPVKRNSYAISGLPIAAASAARVSASGKPIAVSDSTASFVTKALLAGTGGLAAAGAVVDAAGAEVGAVAAVVGAATGAAAGTVSILGLAVSLVTIQTMKSDSEIDNDATVWSSFNTFPA